MYPQFIEHLIVKEANEFMAKYRAKVGVGFKDLHEEHEFYFNENEKFQTASVFKIFILVELYNQAIKGKINLDKRIMVRDSIPGSGILRHLQGKYSIAIKDLARLMMILSDNTATDIIIDIVGKENINKTLEELGLKNTKVIYTCREIISKVLGTDNLALADKKLKSSRMKLNWDFLKNYENNNVSTPKDTIKILELIYHKRILTPEACDEILEIMKKCQTGEARIKRYLPPEVEVAHKTGTLPGIVNDAGLVFTNKQDYILVVYLNEIPFRRGRYLAIGEDFIARLSYKVFRALKSSKW